MTGLFVHHQGNVVNIELLLRSVTEISFIKELFIRFMKRPKNEHLAQAKIVIMEHPLRGGSVEGLE